MNVQNVRNFWKKGVDGMSPKLGQKIKDNPKDKRIEIRMDDETVRKLDVLADEQKVSRAEVIRQGIEIQYENRQK